MQREGIDPENATPADFLCDFCGQPWADDRAMIEGHRGSCLCSKCLTIAYTEAVLAGVGDTPTRLPEGMTIEDIIPGAPPGEADHSGRVLEPCCLCLETERPETHWRSPLIDEPRHRHKLACRRCIKMAASALDRDPDTAWSTPSRREDETGARDQQIRRSR